jgi:hypothetical protein
MSSNRRLVSSDVHQQELRPSTSSPFSSLPPYSGKPIQVPQHCHFRTPPSLVHYLIIYTTLLLFNMFVPIPKAKVSFDLISIYTLIELGHSALRPDSISLLFGRPFLSTTLGHFRSRGWHSIILSLVKSLAIDRMFRLEALTVIQSWMEAKVAITETSFGLGAGVPRHASACSQLP